MPVKLPWSYTTWSAWDQCALKYKLRKIDRLPEGPTPEYLLRGRAIHENAKEFFHTGDGSLIASWHPKAQTAICEAATIDDRLVEHRLYLDSSWQMSKSNSWLVAVCDAAYQSDDMTEVTIDDWKSGKTRNAAYAEELDLYRCIAAHVWPVDRYRIRLVNVDDGKITEATCDRATALASREKWDERAALMQAETEWLPRPNEFCRNCAFANSIGGVCRYG